MHPYLVLLRAVNLAGRNKVRMDELRTFCCELGFANVRTLLQSGNVVFHARTQDPTRLEERLEREAEKRLGLRTEFIVRTPQEWRAVIDRNPFRREAQKMPGALLVSFLKSAPSAAAVSALKDRYEGPEVIHHDGRHLYIVYPEGVGRSRLTSALVEKALGTRGTARNWNTVVKLGAAVKG